MDVVSRSGLRVSSVLWQPRAEAHALSVVCSAWFELRPGESPHRPAQGFPSDVLPAEMRGAVEVAPFKRRTDVLLTGHAVAPNAEPVSSLVARLAVGHVDKSIEVHVDRAWMPNGRVVTGAPFMRMPLVWERAAAGPLNPVGVPSRPAGSLGLHPLPNLQAVGSILRTSTDMIQPVGFGPIAADWPARTALLGRHAATWSAASWNTRPWPDDVDAAFFNAAPPDQQLADFRGDELITLEQLHPAHAHLTTRLARVVPRATVQRRDGAEEEVRLRCDTLWLDADRGLAIAVWRGAVLLAQAGEPGLVVVRDSAAEPGAGADPTATMPLRAQTNSSPGAPISREPPASLFGRLTSPEAASASPFILRRPGAQGEEPAAEPTPSNKPSFSDPESTAVIRLPRKSAAAALPFSPEAAREIAGGTAHESPGAPPLPVRLPVPQGADETLVPGFGFRTATEHPALPFFEQETPHRSHTAPSLSLPSLPSLPSLTAARVADEMTADGDAPVANPATWEEERDPLEETAALAPFRGNAPPAHLVEPAPPPPVPALPFDVAPPPGPALPFDVAPPPGPALPFDVAPPPGPALPFDVAPPPMMGPITPAEKPAAASASIAVASFAAPSIAAPSAERPPAPEESAPAPEIVPVPESEPPPVELTLEQTAALAAELAEGRIERRKLLESQGLRERTWQKNEKRWSAAIEEESARGIHALRGAHDAAYVARVEQFRGPLTVEAYARIVAALERGKANDTLDALQIQRPALLPIVRSWAKKVARDMKLCDATTKALREARREL